MMKTTTKPKPEALPCAGEDARTDGTVLAQLAALQRLSVNELKAKWEDFFATAAPNNSRGFLEVRIAGRIQELTYGGLTRDTCRTLDGAVKRMRTNLCYPKPGFRSGSEKTAPLVESGGAGLLGGVAVLEVALRWKVVVDRGLD